LNLKTLELRLSVLRLSGRMEPTERQMQSLLTVDPINTRALFEASLIHDKKGANDKSDQALKHWSKQMRGDAQNYLELAVDYARAGIYSEAIRVLQGGIAAAVAPATPDPMLYYHLAYYLDKTGETAKSLAALNKAAQLPVDYCFPFRHESEPVLRMAIEKLPASGKAPYYLGNLLYDNQPQAAINAWEQAVQREPNLAMAYRNLALAQANAQHDVPQAITAMEKAMSLDPNNARALYELDVYYEANGAPLEKRLAAMTNKTQVANRRDDASTRLILLYLGSGQYDEALRLLETRNFHNWEGSHSLHDVYVDACLLKGRRELAAGKPAEAQTWFQKASTYPRNQEVGQPLHDSRVGQIQYYQGLAYEALGDKAQAQAAWQKAVADDARNPEGLFHKSQAYLKLGEPEKAKEIQDKLLAQAQDRMQKGESTDYFAKFGEKQWPRLRQAETQYLLGLAYYGAGNMAEAKANWEKTLTIHPGHVNARIGLDQMPK
jgi:tetratricopeptide (TPR) repeat protein